MRNYNVYFDLETYKDGYGEKVPTGGVYGVVCSYHEGYSYNYGKPLITKVFIGVKALYEFLDYLEAEFNDQPTKINLYAYNMPYDFCFMRHDLVRYWSDMKTLYVNLSEDKKIILNGRFEYKNLTFELFDLNMFQRTFALASWIRELNSKYSKGGEPLKVKYSIDGKEFIRPIASKLKIDYDKGDLYEDPENKYDGEFSHINKMYYRNTKGDGKLLDIRQEGEYILIDGLAMPGIYREIFKIKQNFINILRNEYKEIPEIEFRQMVKDSQFGKKQSVSSVSKCIAEMFIQKKFSEVYRFDLQNGVEDDVFSSIEYLIQTNSLLGGLTMGNLDYPKYTTKKGETIASYDVNSMYPYIMSVGMPAGYMRNNIYEGAELRYHKGELSGDYVTGVFIKGTIGDAPVKIEGKKFFEGNGVTIQTPNFDNTFLGKVFLEGSKVSQGFYITRNYWELLNTCCDHNLKVQGNKYQYLEKSIARYINRLNEIKSTAPKESAEYITSKLAMNSLYGKTLEGCHICGFVFGRDMKTFRTKGAKVLLGKRGHDYSRTGLDGIIPIEKEDPELPCRMAGVFVTNTARLILLTGIFDELANSNEFLYADTDSIKLIVRNEVKLPIDNRELGKGKKETGKGKTYDNFNQGRYPEKVKRYAMGNDMFPLEEGTYAFSGIPTMVLKEMKKRNKIEALYSRRENVLFINTKTATVRNRETDQPLIYSTDLMTNNDVRPTFMVGHDLENDKWEFEEYNDEKLLQFGKILVEHNGIYETKKATQSNDLLPGGHNGDDK